MQRRLMSHPAEGKKNSLHLWWRAKNPLLVIVQFIIISITRVCPSLRAKNVLLRLIRVKVGKNTTFGLMAMVDIFWPELITVGENCILGYDSVILCHEFLVNEYRTGHVVIGNNVMIGANCTILAGVVIGDNAVIGAGTVVHEDVPAGAFVIGNRMQIIEGGNQK